MHICIFVGIFPTRSETFVAHHVLDLYRRGYTVSVVSDSSEANAWPLLQESAADIRARHFQIKIPKNRLQRIWSFPTAFRRCLLVSLRNAFKTLDVLRYGDDSLFLKLPFLFDAINSLERVDILHCHFGPNGLLGMFLKDIGVAQNLIVTFHGSDVSGGLTWRRRRRYKTLFQKADRLLPISQRWRDVLITLGAPPERTVVQRLGVNIQPIGMTKKENKENRETIVVTVARLVEKKGVAYGLNAVAKVIEQNPCARIRYEIVGDGPMSKELRALSEHLRLSDIVHFYGALDHYDVTRILARADLFLLPSVTANNGDQEGIPVALMEAMAVGLPVISTRHSGIPELVQHGKSGFLVGERDVVGIADRIQELSACPILRERLGFNARKQIEVSYNAEIQAERLIKLYQDLARSLS